MRLHITAPLGLLGIALATCPTTASASFGDRGSALRIQSVGPLSNLLDEASGLDFWREAKKLGEKATNYTKTILEEASTTFGAVSEKIQEFKSTMADIVAKAEALRDEVQNEITKQNLTIEDISDRLSTELTSVFEELKTEFTEPLPEDKTERYTRRESILNSTMPKIENAFVKCTATWHMSEEDARTRFQEISPHIQKIILITGNVVDHHPVLVETLLFTVAISLIPESWFLRPILGMLGFGPAGPVKGSAAAWAQSRFYGAVVEKGSWFAHLQQAGMKRSLDKIVKTIPLVVGIIGSLFRCW